MRSLRDDMALTDQTITALTGLSQEQINEQRYETAFSYLQETIGTDAYGMEQLPLTKEFWNHWRLIWLRIDQQLLYGDSDYPPVIAQEHTEAQARDLYQEYHNMQKGAYALNGVLIDQAWHQFTKKLSQS